MSARAARRERFERAKALAAAGDHAGARAIVEPMIEADPEDFDAWFVLAKLRLAAGQLEPAGAAADRALAIARKGKALLLAAAIAEQAGDAGSARALRGEAAAVAGGPQADPVAAARALDHAGAPLADRIGAWSRIDAPAPAPARPRLPARKPKPVLPDGFPALPDGWGPGEALALVDRLIDARDFASVSSLLDDPRGAADPLVRATAEARLFFHHQCFEETIRSADRALELAPGSPLPPEQGRALVFTLETIRARSLVTVGRPEAVRFTPGADGPKPTSALRRELDLWWRQDPVRGLAAAQALAFGERPPVRAAVLACTLPLLLGDRPLARQTSRALVRRYPALGAEVPAELMLAAAAVAIEDGGGKEAAVWASRYFAAFGLEAPPALGLPDFSFDRLAASLAGEGSGPRVTVIVTAFNAAATLPTALRSLTAQTHRALEIMVVDDCSTDGTRAVAERAATEDERIIVLANERNIGTYASKNRALARARGTFYTLLDADDWAHPRRIERHLALHAAEPDLAASASDWFRLSEDGRPLVRPSLGVFTHRNPGSAFMRVRDMRDVLGGYEPIRIDADNDHWLRLLAAFGPDRVLRIRAPLTIGRHHAQSLTRAGAGAQNEELYSPLRSAYRARALAWRRQGLPLRLDPDAPARFPDLPELASGAQP